jgi:hypothetical protein
MVMARARAYQVRIQRAEPTCTMQLPDAPESGTLVRGQPERECLATAIPTWTSHMRARLIPDAAGIVALATMLVASPPGHTQTCEGPTFQQHNTKPQPFDTNSHVELGDYEYTKCITPKSQMRKGEFWRIDRCVYNPDSKFPFHFSWFVPEWEAWVPPNCVLEYPHYLPDPVKPGPPATQIKPATKLITSCIEYGNVGRMTAAQYLGDQAEQQAAIGEDQTQCKPLAPLKASSAETPLRPLAFEADLFFPSDAVHPEQTMLTLAATYSIVVDGKATPAISNIG